MKIDKIKEANQSLEFGWQDFEQKRQHVADLFMDGQENI
jgi:hypothetical protein